MTAYDEERLGELLSALPPAPATWVQAAKGLPEMRAQLDRILERAKADDEYRRRVVADPEAALAEAEVVAHSETIQILRQKLDK
jgi:hypothetical protein